MKKIAIGGMFILALAGLVTGQGTYMTNEGTIVFYSHTSIEDITAENNEVASVIDSENGEVAVIVQMTAFKFAKSLMQVHFNENYVESEKFPKAIFKGSILNNQDVDYTSNGVYSVRVEGELTIHGVTNQVSSEGTVEVTGEGVIAITKFLLNPEDYGISIPNVVRKNIAENMEIRINLIHKPI
ncbi:MAG: YceI family protein [Bacteroidales bacterium]